MMLLTHLSISRQDQGSAVRRNLKPTTQARLPCRKEAKSKTSQLTELSKTPSRTKRSQRRTSPTEPVKQWIRPSAEPMWCHQTPLAPRPKLWEHRTTLATINETTEALKRRRLDWYLSRRRIPLRTWRACLHACRSIKGISQWYK